MMEAISIKNPSETKTVREHSLVKKGKQFSLEILTT